MLWWVAGVVGALLLVAVLAPPAPGRRTLARLDMGDDGDVERSIDPGDRDA